MTNYFKFLKWCGWVMAVLSAVHLLALGINMFGTAVQYGDLGVASTTLGNLGSAEDVTAVRIPGCAANRYWFDDCEIDKNSLAVI